MAGSKKITNAFLKGKMTDAMVDRGYCSNLDSCTSLGVFWTTVETTGTFPPNIAGMARYAIVENLNRGGFQIFQRLTSEDGRQAVRTRSLSSGTWSPWKEPVYQ